jgi:hypothetical protein
MRIFYQNSFLPTRTRYTTPCTRSDYLTIGVFKSTDIMDARMGVYCCSRQILAILSPFGTENRPVPVSKIVTRGIKKI